MVVGFYVKDLFGCSVVYKGMPDTELSFLSNVPLALAALISVLHCFIGHQVQVIPSWIPYFLLCAVFLSLPSQFILVGNFI